MFTNETQRLLSGHPAPVLPSPQYMVYASWPSPTPSLILLGSHVAMFLLFTHSLVSRFRARAVLDVLDGM